MSYEFKCIEGNEENLVYLGDLSIYNGIIFETRNWSSKKVYTIKLYYFKVYSDCDGFVSCNRDSDYFTFDDKDSCLKVYEDIKRLIQNKKTN